MDTEPEHEPGRDLSATARLLLAREPLFHREPAGSQREALEAMTAPDFHHVGASGTFSERDTVLDIVTERYSRPVTETWTIAEARAHDLGPDACLLTYLLEFDGRITRRASIWERTNTGRWQVVYHQGTPAHTA